MVGKSNETPRSAWAEALRISDLGLRLVVSVGVLAALGLWLDRRLAWTGFPWFAVAGALLGFGVGMVALVRGLTAGPEREPSRSSNSAEASGPVSDRSSRDAATADSAKPREERDASDE